MKYPTLLWLSLAGICLATAPLNGQTSGEDSPAIPSLAPDLQEQPTNGDRALAASNAEQTEALAELLPALASDDFHARERALKQLVAAGPQAIAILEVAIQSDELEIAWRAAEALQQIAAEGNEEVVEKVCGIFEQAAAKQGREFGGSMNDLRQRWKQMRQAKAVAEIQRLGGSVSVLPTGYAGGPYGAVTPFGPVTFGGSGGVYALPAITPTLISPSYIPAPVPLATPSDVEGVIEFDAPDGGAVILGGKILHPAKAVDLDDHDHADDELRSLPGIPDTFGRLIEELDAPPAPLAPGVADVREDMPEEPGPPATPSYDIESEAIVLPAFPPLAIPAGYSPTPAELAVLASGGQIGAAEVAPTGDAVLDLMNRASAGAALHPAIGVPAASTGVPAADSGYGGGPTFSRTISALSLPILREPTEAEIAVEPVSEAAAALADDLAAPTGDDAGAADEGDAADDLDSLAPELELASPVAELEEATKHGVDYVKRIEELKAGRVAGTTTIVTEDGTVLEGSISRIAATGEVKIIYLPSTMSYPVASPALSFTDGAWATPAAQVTIGREWTGADDGLALLSRLDAMVSLELHDAPLTDAALVHLEELPALSSLHVSGESKLTPAALTALRKRFPALQLTAIGDAMVGIGGDQTAEGFLVANVVPESGAAEAGLIVGDIVTHVAGEPVTDLGSLMIQVFQRKAGDQVELTLLRGGRTEKVAITLRARADAAAPIMR